MWTPTTRQQNSHPVTLYQSKLTDARQLHGSILSLVSVVGVVVLVYELR